MSQLVLLLKIFNWSYQIIELVIEIGQNVLENAYYQEEESKIFEHEEVPVNANAEEKKWVNHYRVILLLRQVLHLFDSRCQPLKLCPSLTWCLFNCHHWLELWYSLADAQSGLAKRLESASWSEHCFDVVRFLAGDLLLQQGFFKFIKIIWLRPLFWAAALEKVG